MYVADWVDGDHRPFTWKSEQRPKEADALGTMLARGDTKTLQITPVEYAWYDVLRTASRDDNQDLLQPVWRAVTGRHVAEGVENVIQDANVDPSIQTTAYRLAALDSKKARARPRRRATVTLALSMAIHGRHMTHITPDIESALSKNWNAAASEESLTDAVDEYREKIGTEVLTTVSPIMTLQPLQERPEANEYEVHQSP